MKEYLLDILHPAKPTEYSTNEHNALKKAFMFFYENGSLKNDGSNDDDDVLKMLKSKEIEGAETDADQQLKNDCDD